MSDTLERLRRLNRIRTGIEKDGPASEIPTDLPVARRQAEDTSRLLADLVPGQEIENEGGICYVSRVAYPIDNDRGGHPLADLLARRPHPLTNGQDFDFRQAAFIDTETTGLGGAGVYAFMVGVGVFEGGGDPGSGIRGRDHESPLPTPHFPPPELRFVVHQFFMRNPAEEAALLTALADLLRSREAVVTFNGRTFDLPLLRGRFSQNRRILSAQAQDVPLLRADSAHLDLLHPARRLWRRRLQSVRLINLEAQILGLTRAESDVPGSLIPYLYVQYLRTGDAREMGRIFYHNREDIVSMVPLAERLCRLFGDPFDPIHRAEVHGLDMLSLGHVYEGDGLLAEAEAAFRHAVDDLSEAGDLSALAHAFDRLGTLLKRQERWAEAAEVWQRWLTTIPGPDPAPYVELAKYCEWQTGDLEQAAMWTGWALHNLRAAPIRQRPPGAIADLEHRLARLQGKMGE